MHTFIKPTAVAIILMAFAGPAQADAIDGTWCHTDHGNFEIRGGTILTPGGTQMSGAYTRHTFRYVAPTGERAATKTINMALTDNETLHLVVEEPGGVIEVWRRCHVNVSAADGSTGPAPTR